MTETSGPFRGDECRHRPGTGLAYGLQRVCTAWGFALSSFYAMKSRQQATAERPPAKRRGPIALISDEALLVAIEADLAASLLGGRGTVRRSGLGFGSVVASVPEAGAPGDRENNLRAPSLPPPWRKSPWSVMIITHAPNLMWGTDGVRMFTVDDGWGWIFTAIEHWNACASAGMCASEATASPPFSRSPWGLRGRMPRPPRCGAGAGLADGSRLPVACRTTSPTTIKFWGIQPSYAFARTGPRPTASPRGSIASASRNRSSMAASTATRGAAERRSAGSSNSTMPSGSWRPNGYLSPAKLVRLAHRDRHSGPPHETNLGPRNRVRYNCLLSPRIQTLATQAPASRFRADSRHGTSCPAIQCSKHLLTSVNRRCRSASQADLKRSRRRRPLRSGCRRNRAPSEIGQVPASEQKCGPRGVGRLMSAFGPDCVRTFAA